MKTAAAWVAVMSVVSVVLLAATGGSGMEEAPITQPVIGARAKTVLVVAGRRFKDSNGNVLADGDAVVLIKDLKVKGSSTTLKMGTKVKSIRLVGGDHEVDCKMDAGSFMLKACFLKKV